MLPWMKTVMMVIPFVSVMLAPLRTPLAFAQTLQQLGPRPRHLVSFIMTL